MSNKSVKLVHPAEVEAFFERIDKADDLRAGKLKCAVSGQPISAENFRAVFKCEGQLFFLSKDGFPKFTIPSTELLDENGE